jgi:RNA 3'-phosphate cyclase
MKDWIEIDGRYGEGGGQVLRTAVSLSALTGRRCRVVNIRAGRRNPGLAAQHLAGVVAAARLCGADLEGASIGAQEVRFRPGEIRGGSYHISVGTAGAVTLVLQALLPVALHADGETILEIEGGTDVAWSPLIDYFAQVHCGYLRDLGANIAVEMVRRGFYPRGGGRVRVVVQPWAGPPGPIRVMERGAVEAIDVWDVAGRALRKARVVERQLKGFQEVWQERYPLGQVRKLYVDAANPGSSFHARARCRHSTLGVCATGRRGKRAEVVGQEAGRLLVDELASGGAVDRWMADQLVPYLGLYGGIMRTSHITEHIRTNIWVTEQFLPRWFTVDGTTIHSQ